MIRIRGRCLCGNEPKVYTLWRTSKYGNGYYGFYCTDCLQDEINVTKQNREFMKDVIKQSKILEKVLNIDPRYIALSLTTKYKGFFEFWVLNCKKEVKEIPVAILGKIDPEAFIDFMSDIQQTYNAFPNWVHKIDPDRV